MLEIISRKDAFASGRKRYFTGRPCSKGHLAERFVTTGGCVKCNAERSKFFKSGLKHAAVAVAQGHFIYPLHPADHAMVLALCQALDMQRGRTPFDPGAIKHTQSQAEMIQAERQRLFGSNADGPPVSGPGKLHPDMERQLREAGFIK